MEDTHMFQRFRNVAATALALGFATSFACSSPNENDDDDGPFADSGANGNNSGNVTSSGATGTGAVGGKHDGLEY
jgi:hypothetical protein